VNDCGNVIRHRAKILTMLETVLLTVCVFCQLAAVDSAKLPWAEEIECGWTAAVVRDDLLALRDFLKQGMEVKVIEEMVHNTHLQLAELTRMFSMKKVLNAYHIQNTVYTLILNKIKHCFYLACFF